MSLLKDDVLGMWTDTQCRTGATGDAAVATSKNFVGQYWLDFDKIEVKFRQKWLDLDKIKILHFQKHLISYDYAIHNVHKPFDLKITQKKT